MNIYPLLMAPYFRSGAETPWGGDMLRDAFLKDAPAQTGESLEISALPEKESVVRNGEHAGKRLSEMIALWGQALTGGDYASFPLLLKLIDARDTLSVQVHPDDAYAARHGGKLGKTEAWVILNCEEDAKLAYGLDTKGAALADIVSAGKIEDALRWVRVRPGDVYYIPSGMVHAIGAGIQLYEIQQSSDITYRFWDWNRGAENGTARPLHIAQALDVARPDYLPGSVTGATILRSGGSQTYYIANRYFELSRLNLCGRMPLAPGRMRMITLLAPCRLEWNDGTLDLAPFDSVLIPAAQTNACLIAEDCKLLQASTPDCPALTAELGYRAENVAGLID